MKLLALAPLAFLMIGCDETATNHPTSASGVEIATVKVPTGSDGLTVEQRNVRDRLITDNKPGSIKHLYVISAMSGQVIIYSTVRGKVTSGGKRLSPTSVAVLSGEYHAHDGIGVKIGGDTYATGEVLQDDGTYGTSDPYIYWYDTRGIYHQHFLSGGQIVHVSDQPLAVHGILINMELSKPE